MPTPDMITLDGDTLASTARSFQTLGLDFSRAMQESLNAVATSATKRMADRFERDIEGGPTPFTRIKPGATSSSVVARRGVFSPGSTGGLSSQVEVRSLQSTYLKYMLGVDRVRDHGDVGAADDWTYVPMMDAVSELAAQGVTLKNGQNLPRGVLKKLYKRAVLQVVARAKAKAKGKAPGASGALKYARIWFGRPYGRPAAATGFYGLRTDKRPKLLILARTRVTYPKDYVIPGWNDSVLDAAKTLPVRMERRLRELQGTAAGGPPIV